MLVNQPSFTINVCRLTDEGASDHGLGNRVAAQTWSEWVMFHCMAVRMCRGMTNWRHNGAAQECNWIHQDESEIVMHKGSEMETAGWPGGLGRLLMHLLGPNSWSLLRLHSWPGQPLVWISNWLMSDVLEAWDAKWINVEVKRSDGLTAVHWCVSQPNRRAFPQGLTPCDSTSTAPNEQELGPHMGRQPSASRSWS